MRNAMQYNTFVQSLENKAAGGMFFNHIGTEIYITDYERTLLAIWDIVQGSPAH